MPTLEEVKRQPRLFPAAHLAHLGSRTVRPPDGWRGSNRLLPKGSSAIGRNHGMSGRRSGTRSVAGWVGALTAAALLLAGCGSTSPTARSTVTPSGSDAASSAGAQVSTTSGSLGVVLVDGQGRTLYVFDADPKGTSGCYDSCATAWPPLATTADPTAAGEAVAKELSTSTRTDGITQVLYGGRPLYTYAQDGAPGQTTGQGLNQQGGTWWVAGIDGAPIKTSAAASATAGSG